jgi:mRNA interferase RelE/StbE
MSYQVKLTAKAKKDLQKIDRPQQLLILSWIKKNLDGTANPRQSGKALTGSWSGYWRYRIGNYRLIAEILDSEIIINVVRIKHRKDIYG